MAAMIIPVLLSGGAGTRLWPLSRQSYPKQFARLLTDHSLFQTSALRFSAPEFAPPVVVTNSDFRFIVTEQLGAAGVLPSAVLIEPEARSTAPAILAAAIDQARRDDTALMIVAPSDHILPDEADFRKAVLSGVQAARNGAIVTFGIKPTRPDAGYGYLELSDDRGTAGVVPLRRFVEKPDAARAAAMIDTGNFLWNSGIFLFSARSMIDAFRAHAPEFLTPVEAAVSGQTRDLGFLRLDPEAWRDVPQGSIDYCVMEKAENLVVVPFAGEWSDLGGWDAVWREARPDENGVALAGHATAIDCADTLLRSESDDLELVGIGLQNIMAIAMPDAVLVADMSRAQDVRLAVAALERKGARQATTLPRDHRPWGWFEALATGPRFQVKRIVVNPGGVLSLQSHLHRAEHWIVVSGTARVIIEDKVTLVTENQSIYVPLGARHRMENPGKVPMMLIEVQTGTYLGEDDITRHEDIYSRD
jgi:mannose-1-phosphate guanylyltransferase / mannose-6-phosphate isomerase